MTCKHGTAAQETANTANAFGNITVFRHNFQHEPCCPLPRQPPTPPAP